MYLVPQPSSIQFNELSPFKNRSVFSTDSYVPKSWVSQRIFKVTHKLLTKQLKHGYKNRPDKLIDSYQAFLRSFTEEWFLKE